MNWRIFKRTTSRGPGAEPAVPVPSPKKGIQPSPSWKPKTWRRRIAATVAIAVTAAFAGFYAVSPALKHIGSGTSRAITRKLYQNREKGLREIAASLRRELGLPTIVSYAPKSFSFFTGVRFSENPLESKVLNSLLLLSEYQFMFDSEKNANRKKSANRRFESNLWKYCEAEARLQFGPGGDPMVIKDRLKEQFLVERLRAFNQERIRFMKQVTSPHIRILNLLPRQSLLIPLSAAGSLVLLGLATETARRRWLKQKKGEIILNPLDLEGGIVDAMQKVKRARNPKELTDAITGLLLLIQTTDSTPIINARRETDFFLIRKNSLVFTNDPKTRR